MFLKHDDGIKILSASASERRLMLIAENVKEEEGYKQYRLQQKAKK